MHIETYTYINAHTQTYSYTHIRIYAHTHIHTHIHINIYILCIDIICLGKNMKLIVVYCGLLMFGIVWYGFIILAELLRSAMCLALFCGFTLFTFVLLLLSLLGVCLGVLSPAAVNSVNHSKSPDVFIFFFICVPMCSVHVSSAVFTSVQS